MNRMKSLIVIVLGLTLAVYLSGCKSTAFTSAKLYLQQENYPKAIEFLEQEIQTNPSNAEAHYLLGYCYARESRYEEMNENFDASLNISNQYANEISNTRKKYWIDSFNAGVRKLQNDQVEEAIKDFETAAVIDPNEADTYKNTAFAYVKLDNHDKAIEYYKKALELESDDTRTMLMLGTEYYNTKQYQECIDTLKKLLELDPANKDAISYLALTYDLMGDRELALKAYEDALQKNPDDMDLYFNRARLFYMGGDYESAQRDFTKVYELNPNDFEAVYNLGNTYLSIEEDIQKKRRELEEQNGDENKINEYKTKEKELLENAKKYLEKAKELNPEHRNCWYNLGVVYIRLGMPKEGEDAFKKAEELEKK